jgi:nucleoside-diphosphate-sugar epimerase
VKKNIIILGSNGSIGTALKLFLKSSYNIYSFDIPDFDVLNKNYIIFFLKKIDKTKNYIIVNCIGLMGADSSKENVEKYLEINSFFPSEFIESIIEKIQIEKYIFLSSETIYGSGKNLLENNKKNPIHPYGISKLIAEINIKKIFNKIKKKIPIIILRIPVVIFQKQKFDNTLTLICNDFKNREITIYGNGTHERNYIFIKDFCEIINLIVIKKMPKLINVFNVPGNRCNSINIVKILQKKYRKKIRLNFKKNMKSFTLVSSSKKFDKMFKFKLKYNLKKIIELL